MGSCIRVLANVEDFRTSRKLSPYMSGGESEGFENSSCIGLDYSSVGLENTSGFEHISESENISGDIIEDSSGFEYSPEHKHTGLEHKSELVQPSGTGIKYALEVGIKHLTGFKYKLGLQSTSGAGLEHDHTSGLKLTSGAVFKDSSEYISIKHSPGLKHSPKSKHSPGTRLKKGREHKTELEHTGVEPTTISGSDPSKLESTSGLEHRSELKDISEFKHKSGLKPTSRIEHTTEVEVTLGLLEHASGLEDSSELKNKSKFEYVQELEHTSEVEITSGIKNSAELKHTSGLEQSPNTRIKYVLEVGLKHLSGLKQKLGFQYSSGAGIESKSGLDQNLGSDHISEPEHKSDVEHKTSPDHISKPQQSYGLEKTADNEQKLGLEHISGLKHTSGTGIKYVLGVRFKHLPEIQHTSSPGLKQHSRFGHSSGLEQITELKSKSEFKDTTEFEHKSELKGIPGKDIISEIKLRSELDDKLQFEQKSITELSGDRIKHSLEPEHISDYGLEQKSVLEQKSEPSHSSVLENKSEMNNLLGLEHTLAVKTAPGLEHKPGDEIQQLLNLQPISGLIQSLELENKASDGPKQLSGLEQTSELKQSSVLEHTPGFDYSLRPKHTLGAGLKPISGTSPVESLAKLTLTSVQLPSAADWLQARESSVAMRQVHMRRSRSLCCKNLMEGGVRHLAESTLEISTMLQRSKSHKTKLIVNIAEEDEDLQERTMTAICFVCNLPILSHQVGLVWQGGNGWDDLVREQVEESTLRQRLGRRDSAAQITSFSPPTETRETSPPVTRRRRSSLAQLTDILREWGSGVGVGIGKSDFSSASTRRRSTKDLSRRETLADLARSLPWGRSTDSSSTSASTKMRKRRESSIEPSKSARSRRESTSGGSDFRSDIARLWSRRDSSRRRNTTHASQIQHTPPPVPQRRGSGESSSGGRSRRDSAASGGQLLRSSRRNSRVTQATSPEPGNYYRQEQRPSTSSTASDSGPAGLAIPRPADPSSSSSDNTPGPHVSMSSSTGPAFGSPFGASTGPALFVQQPSTTTGPSAQALLVPGALPVLPTTIITGATTPPPSSPGTSPTPAQQGSGSSSTSPTAHPLLAATRRDSTTQIYSKGRRDSRPHVSPERRAGSSKEASPKFPRLTRQSTAIDDTLPVVYGRRGSHPSLSPEQSDDGGRKARRDSLSPDSAAKDVFGNSGSRRGRRDSKTHLSPERRGRRDSKTHLSPDRKRRDSKTHLSPERSGGSGGDSQRDSSPCRRLRRQSTTTGGEGRRSSRAPRSPDSSSTCSSRDPSPKAPPIRRQSTTEEILIARGFRRQSTTEEMIRCRNFRRQSSQSDEFTRSRGRRDSCAQITDGTLATMTVETTSTFFDSSTQTEPSPLYDNNHYHEECLRCNSCGLNLTGPNQKRARRFKNQILCDLHFADVALMECSDFMQQLRSFKPQSLGCAVARRKSSTTLIFPLPPQACSDEFCEEFPHNLIPTPGYWIECSRQKITSDTIWDESESEHEIHEEEDEADEERRRPRGPEDSGMGRSEGGESSRRRSSADTCGDPNLGDDSAAIDLLDEESPRKKTAIEEQWEKNQCFELTSVEQETYEKYFYGSEHWNYFTNDEDLGPVILSIKQETLNGRDQFRILVRAISYTVHGLIPASCVFADRYNREEVVRSLGKEVNLNPPLTLGQLPDTPEELLKLDQVFIKSELKVGVIYVKEGQYTEEEILDNNDNSPLFEEFLQILGDKCRLKGFDKYKGGLDTVHDLTGLYSVYTNWRSIEIMFHVSTLLPYEKHDPQKLQRKRHIGNDIVCVVFLEADNTSFSPACIKSHFLHTFILVRTSPRIKRRPTRYEVSVVTRDEVGAYKPYLWEQSVFDKGPMFREWLLTKVVNGERASYSAPKFARMQERTRSQMLEDIVANLQNHAETGQIPKPYRRGSWRPIGHMRPSSPLLDSVRDQFEDYDQLAKDFTRYFLNTDPNNNAMMFDVSFMVGQSKQKVRFIGVRAILGVRSRVFQEILYGISTGFGSPQVPVAEILARAVPSLHSPQKPKSSNFLQVPDIESPRPKSVPNSPMVKRAFTRLGTLTAGWGRSIRKQHSSSSSQAAAAGSSALSTEDRKKWSSSQDCSNKDGKGKDDKSGMPQLAVPRLSVCADVQKVDRTKLAQTEFSIIEFDPDTFRTLLDYLHTGSCPLTCANIPGLICAAEHYDLPELLQACFHHAKQFLRIEVVCVMLCSLENYYWRYTSASELVNMILAFVETKALQLFQCTDFLTLSESMVQMIMCRNLEVAEVRKFEAMLQWARHRIKTKTSSKVDAKVEFKCTMERLARDLKLYRISPQELIKIVLPSKAIKNERILETLMFQANSGMYRIQDSYLEACQQRLQKQDSRFSEWESFDYGL